MDWEVVKKHIVYTTYKIEAGITFSSATPQLITLGYNWIKDLHSSFDLSARYLQSVAKDVDLEYQGLTVLASYFHRFSL